MINFWKTHFRTSLLAFACCLMFGETAAAQKVVRVMKERGVVALDVGTSAGFDRGAKVCIEARGNRVAACGDIVRAQANRSFVRIPQNIERIRRGMTAKLQEGSAKSTGTASTGGAHRRNIKGYYIFSAMTPASFNKLTYKAPEAAGEVDSLWQVSEAASNSLIGFGGEIEFPITNSLSLALGGRYRFYRGAVIEANYDLINRNDALFVEIEQAGSAMGLWIDTYFYDLKFTDSVMLRFSTGLDIDMSEVTFKAERKNDNDAADIVTVAESTSSLGLASLRLGSHFVFLLGPVGLSTSLNAVVPLMAFSDSFSASGDDPNASNLAGGKELAADLQEQLAHQKAMGLEILVGASLSF